MTQTDPPTAPAIEPAAAGHEHAGPPPVIADVRKALGRTDRLGSKPIAPPIPESIVRLIQADADLSAVFAERAKANKMYVHVLDAESLPLAIVAELQARGVKSVGYAVSSLLERSGVIAALQSAGLALHRWDALSLDAAYDVDCGLTDVFKAVAETGSLVIRGSASQGRSLSLVPPLYVAVVEPKNIVADLADLFAHLASQQSPDVSIISGPSKTADIEMNLVTGVHGPGVVVVFVVR